MNQLNFKKNSSLRITIIYIIIGTLWVIFSDFILRIIIPARDVLIYVQAVSDLVFILLTAFLFYTLIKKATAVTDAAMHELARYEKRFLMFFHKSPDMITIVLEKDLIILEVNQSFMDFYGLKREDILGKPIRQFSQWADEKERKEFDKSMAERGYVKNLEGKFRSRNGDVHDFLVSSEQVIINNQKCLLTISRDITEQKKAMDDIFNNKARQHSEFLNTLLNAISNPVFIVSKDNSVIAFNTSFERLPEVEKEQIISFAENIKPEYSVSQGTEGHLSEEAGSIARWPTSEFKYVDDDLNDYYFLVNKAPFYDADGTIGGWMGILDDITDYHKLQAETKKALEREIELNNFKSRFMTNASHEFRTPLTVILASADLLDMFGRNWPEEKYLEHTGKIRRTVKYMTELLDDVLNISRDETGKLSFKPASVNIRAVCQEIIDLARSRNYQNCQIQFDYIGIRETGFVDERLIRQIIMNLLVNALKYSHKNGIVKVVIKTSHIGVVIEIIDEGIGIPEEKLQSVFEPFSRGSNVGIIAGTGLGLSIVKKSVDMHSGSITVRSKVDAGTTVHVNLPFRAN